VSQLFSADGRDLWWPATTAAQLFFQTAEAMVLVSRRPHGIRDLGWDEYDIDVPTYQEFVRELAQQYLESRHTVLMSLIEGFLPTALALLRKAGGDVPLLAETAEENREQAPHRGPSAPLKARKILALTNDLSGFIST
jgi:hypothetical protein